LLSALIVPVFMLWKLILGIAYFITLPFLALATSFVYGVLAYIKKASDFFYDLLRNINVLSPARSFFGFIDGIIFFFPRVIWQYIQLPGEMSLKFLGITLPFIHINNEADANKAALIATQNSDNPHVEEGI